MLDVDEQEARAVYLALMAEIAYLAVAVNEFTDFCVFLDYSGHVRSMSVEIAASKTRYNDKLASTEFYAAYADKERPWKVAKNASLLAKRDHLKSILEEGDIDLDAMEAVQTMTVHYEF